VQIGKNSSSRQKGSECPEMDRKLDDDAKNFTFCKVVPLGLLLYYQKHKNWHTCTKTVIFLQLIIWM
jgi:hypothetical protein